MLAGFVDGCVEGFEIGGGMEGDADVWRACLAEELRVRALGGIRAGTAETACLEAADDVVAEAEGDDFGELGRGHAEAVAGLFELEGGGHGMKS